MHSSTWPTLLGDSSWDSGRPLGQPTGSFALILQVNGKLVPVYPADRSKAAPAVPKPCWGG